MSLVSAESTGTTLLEVEGHRAGSPVLTGSEARELVELGLRIEQLLGGPQDIEWAHDDGRLWILQARPITALSPHGE